MLLIAILVHKMIFYTQMYLFVTRFVIDKSDIPEITVILCFAFKFSFYFIFFPDRCTLKFISVQCNPTNKKSIALQD